MKTSILVPLAFALGFAATTSASAASLSTGERPPSKPISTSCGSATSCNALISKCAEWGGHWAETGKPGAGGRPVKGTCTH